MASSLGASLSVAHCSTEVEAHSLQLPLATRINGEPVLPLDMLQNDCVPLSGVYLLMSLAL
ncbi:hypothetical protein D3C71_2206170 [compost metagenome]